MNIADQLRIALPPLADSQGLTVQEIAYRRMRLGLLTGSIPPGNPVTVRGLAEALDISPTPVREALRRLSAEGGLVVLENRRITTPPMNQARFVEMLELRVALERHAAGRALPYMTDVLIDQLEGIDLKLDEVHRSEHVQSVLLNQAFHRGIYAANPDCPCLQMIESIWLQLGPFTRLAALMSGELYTIDRHKDIINALRNRDQVGLMRGIESDIRDATAHLTPERLDGLLG
ncbi:MAG: GntR family transcriptional regulator [Gammaproteobacteria bacterium]|nr:GntR family transcriptional regulator [Gammaproteobacteria bacterium]